MKSNLKISIIIPTHNREYSLKRLLNNIFDLNFKSNYEIIVVDNNSTDNTFNLVKSYKEKVKYVFEPNTSFTKARFTGAQNAQGDILLYLDDDVILNNSLLEEIVRIFSENDNCVVAGGKILPLYEQDPPKWILDLQQSFNGFSLYDLGDVEKKVDAIPGPCMAIRKDVFFEVGGFPPDTIGVETNTKKKTFRKLYLGLGDYGFCFMCKKKGYEIIYSPKIKVKHVIPPFRLKKEFWLSRMVGEGHCLAMSNRKLDGFSYPSNRWINCKQIFKHFLKSKLKRFVNRKTPLFVDEMWLAFYLSLNNMDKALNKNKKLADYLWNLGYEGVSDNDFEKVLSKLPREYKKLSL